MVLCGDVDTCTHLGREAVAPEEGGIGLVHHDITGLGHVILVKALDVHADEVTGDGLIDPLVVLLDREHLPGRGNEGSNKQPR